MCICVRKGELGKLILYFIGKNLEVEYPSLWQNTRDFKWEGDLNLYTFHQLVPHLL